MKFLCHCNTENIINFHNFINNYFFYNFDVYYSIYKINTVVSGLGLSSDPLIRQFDSKKECISRNLKLTNAYSNDLIILKLKFPNSIIIPVPDNIPTIFTYNIRDLKYYAERVF